MVKEGYRKVRKLPHYRKIDIILGRQDNACPICNKSAIVFFSKGYKYTRCDKCGIYRIKADYKAFHRN